MDKRDGMIRALTPLWSLRPPAPAQNHPLFESFKSFCRETFPAVDKGMGLSFALWDGLRAIGLPCALPATKAPAVAPALEDAVDELIAAIEAKTATRRYLCPLDFADTLPEMRFGQAHIARFDNDQLRDLFDDRKLSRLYRDHQLDVDRLSWFHWLVVEETVTLPTRIGERALPFLYQSFGGDMGAIDPHASKYPPAVSRALFGLLLAPWEEWHSHGEMDWCGFRMPWVHLEGGDIFLKTRQVPSADELTWEPAGHEGDDGEIIEYERPIIINLDDAAEPALAMIDQDYWELLEAARRSPLFETPIEHFMVHAYFAHGMDEIMAHMTAIEAGVGLRSDFPTPGQPKPPASSPHGKRIGAKQRVVQRISKLLGDLQAGSDYGDLYELRSAFVHGRPIPNMISSANRNLARSLARRIVVALVDAANATPAPTSREDFLSALA